MLYNKQKANNNNNKKRGDVINFMVIIVKWRSTKNTVRVCNDDPIRTHMTWKKCMKTGIGIM